MIQVYIDTLSELLRHPRNVIDHFLEGEKGRYTHPFLFLFAGAVLVVMINTLLVDYSIDPVLTEMEGESEQVREIAGRIQVSTVRFTTQFLPLSAALILVPGLSLAGLVFFRNYLSGFYELLVMNSYVIGVSMGFQLLLIPIWIFSGIPLTDPLVNATLPALVIAIAALRIYRLYILNSSFLTWIRMISTFIVGYLFYAILAGFAASVTGYMIFAIERIGELSGSI